MSVRKRKAAFFDIDGTLYREGLITEVFKKMVTHVEVTTLIIPGMNDDERFIREEAQWLASLDPDIPLILSRYFPRYHYQIPATDPRVIYHLRDIAAEYLNDVYTGNC